MGIIIAIINNLGGKFHNKYTLPFFVAIVKNKKALSLEMAYIYIITPNNLSQQLVHSPPVGHLFFAMISGKFIY